MAAAAAAANDDHILTLTCPDRPGIVHAVTGVFSEHGHNILDLQQFSDPASRRFFMRVHFGPAGSDSGSGSGSGAESAPAPASASGPASSSSPGTGTGTDHLAAPLSALAARYGFTHHDVRPVARRTRVLIMVSKMGHCLNDLLFRIRSGQLRIDVPVVVSNHADYRALVEGYGIEFHHLPVSAATKPQQEARVLDLVAAHDVELVVLARYMQVLSPTICAALSGRIINIHHSFLPSFKGARPYHQAYDRGVKTIGATAHFVTADLDEGPIIEQRVARVDHAMGPRDLAEHGSNVESQVLAAAVGWYADRRVFLNGPKTVVFA